MKAVLVIETSYATVLTGVGQDPTVRTPERTGRKGTPWQVQRPRPRKRLPLTSGWDQNYEESSVFKRLTLRTVERRTTRDIERYIETLGKADTDEMDLLWCLAERGRDTLEAIDSIFGNVLYRPWDYVHRGELSYAQTKLTLLIRQAQSAGELDVAKSWIPWLHTLRATHGDLPELLVLGQRMWALIDPPELQAEHGESCLTPEGFRADLISDSHLFVARSRAA